MRTFIAIEMAPGIRRALGGVIGELKQTLGRQGWVRPENLHLTLKFLGEIEPNDIMPISNKLEAITAAMKPFHLEAAGIGCFPDERRPRVIWAGLGGDLDTARTLVRTVDDALAAIGYPRERKPFSPHVTLARVRTAIDTEALAAARERYRTARFGSLVCDHLVLMESHLGSGGSHYTPLATFPFGHTA